jgi:DtxR family Mn-dependent transcriptional regulator
MSHDRDLADQDVEEVAEELWTLAEQGCHELEELRRTTQVEALEEALAHLSLRGLVRVEGGRVTLTPEGRTLAERQVRRHRLAEVLFTVVLEVGDDAEVNRTACVMEHVLGASLTDSICSFLGHPPACPHGKAIPAGSCCRTLTAPLEPLVQPLDRMPLGQPARIVYIAPRQRERLVRLANMGLVPGATVCLDQRSPAAILRLGETTLAVDTEVAGEIYVKRAG